MAPLELLLEVAASNVVVAQGDISLSSSSLLVVAAVVVWFVIVHWVELGRVVAECYILRVMGV